MNIEDIDKALRYPNIKIINEEIPEGAFDRCRKFVIGNNEYKIEWWANVSYLFHNNLTISFYGIDRNNYWPHQSNMNLVFKDINNQSACILKIE